MWSKVTETVSDEVAAAKMDTCGQQAGVVGFGEALAPALRGAAVQVDAID